MPQTIRNDDRGEEDEIVDVEIVDLEKKRELRKYYVYVIEVSVKRGPKYIVYRRYNQFHNLHQVLDERYPIEAGHIDAKDRVLPNLPGKIYLGRSAVKDVAEERIPQLNVFIKTLIGLTRKISHDEFVQRFLRQNEHDGKPYTGSFPYRGQSGGGNSPKRQREVRPPPPAKKLPGPPARPPAPPKRPAKGPVLPQKRSGLSPAAGLLTVPLPSKPPVAKKPIKGPRARGLHTFNARNSEELSFKKGDIIKLRQRISDDWLEGELDCCKGLVPITYVEIIEDLVLEHSDTDEWDDDDDDDETRHKTINVLCRYKGNERVIGIPQKVAHEPSYLSLLAAVKSALSDFKVTLNYKDVQGDLVRICDDDDIRLLMREGVPKKPGPKLPNRVQWQLHVTRSGDLSVYNVKPKKPKAKTK
ncbi:neutrophil cytosol factor 4-like [Corticium candelabrum]|uniref:neutrophil cytosol factor 4-like n=1 Tax=Corticium candelabrum TaxID=121492 RepID=UPI002E359A57|nr:neutrophil cytosol factor 4-like [Corticium candelabrum]